MKLIGDGLDGERECNPVDWHTPFEHYVSPPANGTIQNAPDEIQKSGTKPAIADVHIDHRVLDISVAEVILSQSHITDALLVVRARAVLERVHVRFLYRNPGECAISLHQFI